MPKDLEKRRKRMPKQTCISIVFGIASHEKSIFLKKVHVRESYDLLSRIRVAEGWPKQKGNQTKDEKM